MAKDCWGVFLIMATILRSTEGRRLLSTKKKFKHDDQMDDWLLLVELLLEWEAHICSPTMKKKDVKRLDRKNRYIMCTMKKVAKRSKGMGLNIMKFHAITHLAGDTRQRATLCAIMAVCFLRACRSALLLLDQNARVTIERLPVNIID